MLRDQIAISGMLAELPHVSGGVADAAVGLFSRSTDRATARCGAPSSGDEGVRGGAGAAEVVQVNSLQRAFGMADSTRGGALSVVDFLRYIGQGGVLHVSPAALALRRA